MIVRRRALAAVLVGAGVALVVACGARSNYAARPEVVPSSHDAGPLLGARPDEVRAKITELSDAIEADRTQLGTGEPTPEAMSAMTDVAPQAAAMTCERSARDTCVDVCKLGDSICSNAGSICDLALQLPGDAWAAERCDAGKASCKTASEKCCAC